MTDLSYCYDDQAGDTPLHWWSGMRVSRRCYYCGKVEWQPVDEDVRRFLRSVCVDWLNGNEFSTPQTRLYASALLAALDWGTE